VMCLLVGCATSPVHEAEITAALAVVDQPRAPAHLGASVAPVVSELTGPHPVETYILQALAQNADIQAARLDVEAAGNRVPQAASLADPMLMFTFLPNEVQTAAGAQKFVMNGSQQFPWFGKLRLRAEAAERQTDVARAQLAAMELSVVEEVKRAYYELYFLQKAIEITRQDRDLLLDLMRVAESKYQTGQVSQQDVLRAQVETLNLDKELVQLEQQLQAAKATLARLMHISPETDLQAVAELPPDSIDVDLDWLYSVAIQVRPELQAHLAAAEKERANVELAKLEYFPNVTANLSLINIADSGLSPVRNGDDALLLGFGVNLPVYHKRLQAGVREAQANMAGHLRRYDSLKDRTQEQIKQLFTQVKSQLELLQLFQEGIVPKAEQTLQLSRQAYQVGQADFLTLVDNWQQLLRFQIAQIRLESQLHQSLAALERVVGGSLQAGLSEVETTEEETPTAPALKLSTPPSKSE
jgi:cobalt-zinc-cadmium efflux system outer membrane protein